jgi:hypothetical protein
LRLIKKETTSMDELRPAALLHLTDAADKAAARHENPLARLSDAWMDAAASSADPYLIIDNLLNAVAHVIAARVPLSLQHDIACDVETRVAQVLEAWKLK